MGKSKKLMEQVGQLDLKRFLQVIYGPKNLGISSCANANEDGCQSDRDNRNRNMGLFWYSREAQPAQHTVRINN